MKIVFKEIPKLAVYFYAFGFIILIIALINFFTGAIGFENILTQQLFIGGAIVVALGSVINTVYQFKS